MITFTIRRCFPSLCSNIFPAEIVFATLEVKSVLTKRELRKSLDAIMQIRAVGSQKRYITPATILEDGKPKSVLVKLLHKVPPRSYIVAFSQQGMGPTYQHFCK